MRTYLYFVTVVAALAGLMFGFETGVINGAMEGVADFFNLSPAMKGFAVSSALIGCIIGALGVGIPSDKYGRREMLKVTALLFLASMIGAGLAPNIWIFIASRFIGGIAIGAASGLVPVYISEVAPPEIRGRLVVFNQIALVFGILFAFFSNFIILRFIHFARCCSVGYSIRDVPNKHLCKRNGHRNFFALDIQFSDLFAFPCCRCKSRSRVGIFILLRGNYIKLFLLQVCLNRN